MNLLLIRHAETKQDPNVPSSQWRLTERAYEACEDLAKRLRRHNLSRIISSEEVKAKETGRVLAKHLGISWSTAPNLHEHERSGVPYTEQAAWLGRLESFFKHPDDLILGSETGTQARRRFDSAARGVLGEYPNEPLAIVAHASVMALFVAHYNEVDVFSFWRGSKMPDVVALSLPDFAISHGRTRS